MFDNNQSFNNNPKPLFKTDFNNSNIGEEYNNLNNFNGQNNIFDSNEFTNNLSGIDIPPELGEIKNLNEATVVSAPTLDVLGPINIMPEKSVLDSDPLSAYDQGNINLLKMDNNSSNGNDTMNFSTNNSFLQTNYNNISSNNDFANEPSNFNFDYSNQNFSNQLNSSFEENKVPIFNTDTSYKLPEEKNSNDLSEDFNQLMNTDYNSKDKFSFDESNAQETAVSSDITLFDEQKNNKDYTVIPNENINEPNYTIIQDKDINKSEDLTNLSDLGIPSSYEEDILDIMDLEESNGEDKAGEEKPLLIENVEKIRKLVREIKESGLDISIEEFDFEHMYQLIVKINK